ncbi:MAG: sigma-70 family RNA polymerase sigma factor [bacterium]|nr:sigma-70 family RNA polymerase sigma factor [bacterium]
MTDDQLIQASREGDEQAFKELIRRYESRVASTVIGMLGNCTEAEDVGQETFIRFYNNLKNFRGDASVGTYLTRIAINLSLNELKRRKRKSLIFFRKLSDDDFDIPDENSNTGFDDNKELVQQAIQKLEPKFRSVLVLRLMDGYSTAETAEILKLPIGTVLSRLARAQEKLKHILSPYLGDLK